MKNAFKWHHLLSVYPLLSKFVIITYIHIYTHTHTNTQKMKEQKKTTFDCKFKCTEKAFRIKFFEISEQDPR